MKMPTFVKLLCLMLCILCTGSVVVRNGVYDNVVIEIQKDVSDEDCGRFLATLENILTSSSQYLHTSLDGRIFFSSFEIIIPSTWSYNCLTNSSAVTSYNGASTDIQITKSNPIFGDDLWTRQSSGCGERGDQIYISDNSIRDDFENLEKKLVNEFMKYRYGVFDTNGFDGDAIYPKCSASGNPMCSDAITLVADGNSYNKYFPNKQNQLCDRMSRMDVILRNVDFNGTERNQNFTPPAFNYVRKMSTRYMLLLDDHADISIRDSYGFLRDSIRKWLDKDLVHHGTEVGIIRLNSNSSADPIKSISGSDDREEIFSNLPFSVTNRGGFGKCNIYGSILKTIGIMKERSMVHGDAISSIILIGPGMYNCSDDVINEIVDKCRRANVKIVTINYPNIGINRVPMDELARLTDGDAFTVIERKQNEEKSYLSTLFELTNVFMHISSKFHHGDASELPVEIYRKELIDKDTSGDSTKSRTYTDSFNVDDTTKNINFFVYNYDRKYIGIDSMSLTSPNQMTFSKFTELRPEYHQLSIVGNLSGIGSWHYNIKRFFGNPQPHYVQVLAYPKADTNNFIRARAWIRRAASGGPNVIYAEVMQGQLPILDASVEVTVKLPNGRDERIQLFDSGSGDPDVTKGDGVYSRYFAAGEPGMYKFSIKVTDNGNTAYSQIDRDSSKQIHCCGSAITTKSKQPVTPFTRFIIPITLFVNNDEIEAEKSKIPFIGRIGDLHIVPQSINGTEKVTLEWTGPDTGIESSKITYEIRYANNLKDIVDNFDVIATPLHLAETIPHSIGLQASVTLNLSNEIGLIGVPFYIAIRSINEDVSTGPISNVVRIYVPKRRPTVSPSYTHSLDSDIYETEPSMEPVDEDEKLFTKLGGFPWQILIPIVVCCLLILIIITVYCWCCVARKRSYTDSKKKPSKSPSKPSISVITPTTPSYQPQPVQQNQYHIDPVASNGQSHSYLVDVPDHHTIGLPMIDDDMMKPDFSDHDKMLIEEMKQQQRFQQQALIDAYGDQHPGILTRNGQYLSPYESWSASTLLAEHEVRQSPMEHEGSMMYVDANGEMVPPIPPHPYNGGTYGYTAPPPTYTSVYRPLVRGVPGQGSMQSVVSSAMMSNGDAKKIRNVTMV